MFREDKATELAAYLIRKADGKLNYTVLLKAMYYCDRETLIRWGMPVTYDTWCSMPYGPVLSRTYDLIKGDNRNSTGYWARHIKTDNYDVTLTADPGDDSLSDADVELADKAFEEFCHLDYWEAISKAHAIFGEWTDPGGSTIPIALEKILRTYLAEPDEAIAFAKRNIDLQEAMSSASHLH